MRLYSRLKKSRHGIYYLRIQQDGIDRRWSISTRDPEVAAIAAYNLGATIAKMKIDPTKIKSWTLESDGQSLKVTTEDNDDDRESAIEALVVYAKVKATLPPPPSSSRQPTTPAPTISLDAAIKEYEPHLMKSKLAEKSKKMALSTLNNLMKRLGADFDLSKLTDDVIESKWLEPKLTVVAETTVKRDLSFIRAFVAYAADKKRRYCPAPLTLTLEAKGQHWSYLDAKDLDTIFSNLDLYTEKPWQFWLPIIGLYTGARIGEIASLKTSYFSEKLGLQVMHLEGTKTDASPRDLPIHPALIQLGFLDYVNSRRNAGHKMVFDIPHSAQNGWGAAASKWYTTYKAKIGLTDKKKVFHSFRPTIVDHLMQHGSDFEARCQYVGHDSGGGVHSKVYGRNGVNLELLQKEVVHKIDWQKYCGWSPNLVSLKIHADKLLKATLSV
ncbi:site-specific integrase [Methylotenera sp.]|uniref:site-specific integrase n=1 Tax=Methylotenera sp. TaxID=2051956 RepID=UPI00271C2E2C|nr:site-specific integrase [Methylotenera sp.]MDO9204703.1 site-specific integrase [Methylotenera sp.]MDP1522820.1 site-specific integrase [Methylotenera sp.]MDP3818363.1 site-specific integrase [Methylotenera sp.]MDZ4210893.1 site-specific integrase [Methylotenera sp.]